MGKVTGVRMTDDERQGLKEWFCQECGSELDAKLAADPTARLKCSNCGASWWATTPPDDADVEERTAARKKANESEEKRQRRIAEVRGRP